MAGNRDGRRPLSVVRLVVSDKTGRVLLLRRAKVSYGCHAWCLPGGKIDHGETVEGAARRELREETGLVANRIRFLFYQDSLPLAAGEKHYINLYLECETSGELTLNEESKEPVWVGPEDLGRYDVAFGNDLALRRYWSGASAGQWSR